MQYKDICKWDLKALEMDLNRWETLTSERSAWRQVVHHSLSQFEETLVQQAEAKRQSRKQQNQGARRGTDCICLQCGRDGHSRISLLSHTRCCSKSSIQSMISKSLETEGCLINEICLLSFPLPFFLELSQLDILF